MVKLEFFKQLPIKKKKILQEIVIIWFVYLLEDGNDGCISETNGYLFTTKLAETVHKALLLVLHFQVNVCQPESHRTQMRALLFFFILRNRLLV